MQFSVPRALAFLITFRLAQVRLPPLLSSWSQVGVNEVDELHEIFVSEDAGSRLVQESLQVCGQYDFEGLQRGWGILFDMWKEYKRRHRLLAPAIAAALLTLHLRQMPRPAHSRLASAQWLFLDVVQDSVTHQSSQGGASSSSSAPTNGVLGRRWAKGLLHPLPGAEVDFPVPDVPVPELQKLLLYWRQQAPDGRLDAQVVPPWAVEFLYSFDWDEERLSCFLAAAIRQPGPADDRIFAPQEPVEVPQSTHVPSHSVADSPEPVPMITRASPEWCTGVASWEVRPPSDSEDEGSIVDLVDSTPASSTVAPVRKTLVKNNTKWGRCQKCHLSLRPHIFRSGQHSGEAFFVCSGFFQRVGENQRRCWWRRPVSQDEFRRLPLFFRNQHKSLVACLQRNGRAR